jgi:hypothetical protein
MAHGNLNADKMFASVSLRLFLCKHSSFFAKIEIGQGLSQNTRPGSSDILLF